MRALAFLLPPCARGWNRLRPSRPCRLSWPNPFTTLRPNVAANLHTFAASPFALFPALGLLLMLSGCGGDSSDPPATNGTEGGPAGNGAAPFSSRFALVDPQSVLLMPAAEPLPRTPAPAAETVESEPAASPPADSDEQGRRRYKAGEDPAYARQCGWPVTAPEPLPGAILPARRLVAYYGNPNSRRMGVLGEYEKDEMVRRLLTEAQAWEEADPRVPVQPALHLVAVVAQGTPGKAGKYRMIMPDAVVNRVYDWAREIGAVLFIDIQTGRDDLRELLPRFEWILANPDVHLAIDPEFNMGTDGPVPGARIGSFDAAEINYASDYLAELVRRHDLPPKVFIVHRFTQSMVTNASQIGLRPEVQVVMHMDGWGAPWLKRDTYRDFIVEEPVQYTGFKLFYHNDTKKGDPLMMPEDVLRLQPQPLYIQYQ